MPLEEYKKKRDFAATPEPEGEEHPDEGRRFVIQEHHASRLHFDLRLEMDGVLKSWAVPKGPSLDPGEKRLAVMTEDHPLEYLDFYGTIPEGSYGAGEMAIWDRGTYEPLDEHTPEEGVGKGKLTLILNGHKIRGEFHMVRMKSGKEWLLFKAKDEFADPEWKLQLVIPEGKKKKQDSGAATSSTVVSDGQAKTAVAVEIGQPAEMPEAVKPMLATLADEPFSDPDWLYELKWDGYRCLCHISGDSIRMVSRNELDLGERFPGMLDVRQQFSVESAVVDGEIVALDANGIPSFQMLQNAYGFRGGSPSGSKGDLVYYAFDLIYCNGRDLSGEPLEARKDVLRQVIGGEGRVRYSDHVREHGLKLYEQAETMGLEGIIAKLASSKYEHRRSRSWLKIKTVRRQEVVIGGYTSPRNTRSHFGALVVGLYDQGELRYVGHTGGGFSEKSLKEIHDLMKPLKTDTSPFVVKPKTNEKVQWVRPELVCEVKFTEWTDDGRMRHPIFLGVRPDKDPKQCILEQESSAQEEAAMAEAQAGKADAGGKPGAAGGAADTGKAQPVEDVLTAENAKGDVLVRVDSTDVCLTNVNKVYWPDEGYTKLDLIRYYYKVAEFIVPHLTDRPLILQRYPNGIQASSFHQHNVEDPPDYVEQWRSGKNDDGERNCYALCNNIPTLLWLANLGTIAQHPWNSRHAKCEYPDWVVFDLDPDEKATYGQVCQTALLLKETLDKIGLKGYAKTSGSSGIHVYVPVEPLYTHLQVTAFAELVARAVQKQDPETITVERMTKKRPEATVYLDYLQNGEGKSLASVYSVRAKPGATVSTALDWDEVEKKTPLSEFTIHTVPDRLAEKGDLFRAVLEHGQKLGEPLDRIQKLF